MASDKQRLLSQIPQIDQLLNVPEIQTYLGKYSRDFICHVLKQETAKLRQQLLHSEKKSGDKSEDYPKQIIGATCRRLDRFSRPSLKRVVNGTGVILHTGLGRAPLSDAVREQLTQVTTGYCNLEIDLETGKRSNRSQHIEELLCFLTGAEAACVVNNNAAAVFLTLNTLSFARESIISRGQLIEIGGSFRIPDVMEKSGAIMKEVGTTNKTHLRDYERAISEKTGLICLVHPSNYRIKGFVADVSVDKLVELGIRHDIPVMYDLGGGVLFDLQQYGLPYEPVAGEGITAGLDVVTFSGDKILGGPQSGIIVGKRKYIDKIKQNALMRVLRCDKLIYAALEATLKLYLNDEQSPHSNQVMKIFLSSIEEIEVRAQKIIEDLRGMKLQCDFEIRETQVQIGSGALPLEALPSRALACRPLHQSTESLAKRLRLNDPPIVGYVREDWLFLDLRTILNEEDKLLIEALRDLLPSA